MLAYDVATKLLGSEEFPQNNIADTHTHITHANTNTRTYTHSLSLLEISWTWRYFLGRYVALSFVQKVLLQLKQIGHFLFSTFQLQEAADFDCE